MWDYSFAIPSLFIISIILLFYFSLPRLTVKMNRAFLRLLIIEAVVIVSDIVSSWGDENYTVVPSPLLYLLNMLYFFSYFARAYYFYVFTCSFFRIYPDLNRLKLFLGRFPFYLSGLICISCPFTGLIFSITENGYKSGPLYDLVYYISYFYLAVSFYITFVHKSRLSRRRYWYYMLMCNMTILVGIITRKAFPYLLLMDTFCLIAILIVYLGFMNPDFYLEHRGTVFNGLAFRDFIDENNGNLSHRVLGVQVHNYGEMRDIYGGRQMDIGVEMISRFLTQTFTGYNVFYYRNGRYFILGDRAMDFENMMQIISERFTKAFTADDLELYLDVGFATIEMGVKVESSDLLLQSMVMAMEKAGSRRSKDPVVMKEADLKHSEYETSVKRLLEKAVDENSVEVFLQPIVDAHTGQVVGAEALSRIRNNEGNLIPPKDFIPIAERNGRINMLGEQVFEKTCEFIKNNELQKKGISWINVNLSPMQFMRTDLAERYAAIVEKYEIDPKSIHLEITEESMIDDFFLRKQITAMQGKGFIFVLDDYGTGYSNLTRLKNCPFINIKLDMSIVWDYYHEPDDILPNMIQAFKHMNFSVTAEGIEDEDMAEAMRRIGCDYFQGYNYSRPMPMEEFLKKYGTK